VVIYWTFEILAVVDSVHWKKFSLFGHSVGGGVLCTVAGIIPNRIEKNILIDGIQFWWTTQPGEVVSELNTFYNNLSKIGRPFPLFSTEEECFNLYMKFYYGLQESVVRLMFQRSLKKLQVKESNGKIIRKYTLSISPYIAPRSIFYQFSESHRAEIHGQIKAPTLIFLSPSPQYEEQKNSRINELICKYWLINFDGSHHAHIEKPELFVDEMVKFLMSKPPYNEENWQKPRL